MNGHGRWRLFSRLLVVVGGAVVVMCERSWAVVAVFVWWRSLVVVLGGCSRFCVVVFDRGPLGWGRLVVVGRHVVVTDAASLRFGGGGGEEKK